MARREYKYRLIYLLKNLEQDDYELSLKQLPQHCGVSRRTFERWVYIKKDSHFEIPLNSAMRLALWFQVSIEELYNN